mmetsp:Transcript_26974/g.41818  ORF Transcript_26974/g.41818 Transcript_26974/m.41818 type:complete len:657 (-) Transcript_26974:98-2068(-)|eukprot:CAMPEP_0196815042 /NCGR_PEP_ID=MMETSP1362-20130617/47505_1 /TAXON_ID=163516 /ORGANISM="Leptocylindrus danicus, Strain CCMP1856" /LENGTH=656 /DNA_ID=CAMNT_0042191881 /DNA_START=166 /DNA_END=2136 /DNA_ORIENTATION=+
MSHIVNLLARQKKWRELEGFLETTTTISPSSPGTSGQGEDNKLCLGISNCNINEAMSYACRYDAPLSTVKSICNACNQSNNSNGSDLTGTSKSSGTILHEAVARAKLDVLEYLLDICSADHLVVQDVDGQVCLHILVRRIFNSPESHHPKLLELMEKIIKKNPRCTIIADRNLYEENPLVLALKTNLYCDLANCENLCLQMTSLILRYYAKSASSVSPSGYTPLHSATYHGRSLEVMQEIISHYKGGCLVRNSHGEVPLHFLCMRFDDTAKYSAILDNMPASARCKDANGLTPLHWTFIRYLALTDDADDFNAVSAPLDYTKFRYIPHNYEQLANLFVEHVKNHTSEYKNCLANDTSTLEGCDVSGDFRGFWARIRLLLEAGYTYTCNHDTEDDRKSAYNQEFVYAGKIISPSSSKLSIDRRTHNSRSTSTGASESSILVHASCMVPCPLYIARVAHYLDDSAIRRRDALGRLPLHYACMYEDHCWSMRLSEGSSRTIEEGSAERIGFVLPLFPQAARIRDVFRRLPLHWALDNCNIDVEVIYTLLGEYPAAINLKDGITKLYPFMQAAASASYKYSSKGLCVTSNSSDPSSNRKDTTQGPRGVAELELGLVYHLLKKSPDIVRCALSFGSFDDTLMEFSCGNLNTSTGKRKRGSP